MPLRVPRDGLCSHQAVSADKNWPSNFAGTQNLNGNVKICRNSIIGGNLFDGYHYKFMSILSH